MYIEDEVVGLRVRLAHMMEKDKRTQAELSTLKAQLREWADRLSDIDECDQYVNGIVI